MVHARRTVAAASCSIRSGCIRCSPWSPIAALSTACKKYSKAWVESATMQAMTSVRVNSRIRFGGRVTSLVSPLVGPPGRWLCLLGPWAGLRGGGVVVVHCVPSWKI